MLDNSIPDHEISIITRKDRNRNGGGVAIFVKNTIDRKIRYDLMNNNLETITIEVSKYKIKVLFNQYLV